MPEHAAPGLPLAWWGSIVALSVASYASLTLAGLEHALAVSVGFLVVPMGLLVAAGRPLALGRLDRSLGAGLAAHGIALAYRLPRVLASPRRFDHLVHGFLGPEPLVYLSTSAAIVMPVDFFVRRVIQREAHQRWGARVGIVLAVLVWLVGHVREYVTYLSDQVGPVEGWGYLAVTGVAGALLYARWPNVLGFMIGHVALNVAVALLASVAM